MWRKLYMVLIFAIWQSNTVHDSPFASRQMLTPKLRSIASLVAYPHAHGAHGSPRDLPMPIDDMYVRSARTRARTGRHVCPATLRKRSSSDASTTHVHVHAVWRDTSPAEKGEGRRRRRHVPIWPRPERARSSRRRRRCWSAATRPWRCRLGAACRR